MVTLTRIAPTPSGFLHIGNAWSFILTWLIARSQGSKIFLRIDDLDTSRFRIEYLEDIFISLQWLGINWDAGPVDAQDFLANYRQSFRHDQYRQALEFLIKEKGNHSRVYACQCSREQIKNASIRPGIYPQTCLEKNLPLQASKRGRLGKGIFSENSSTAIRINIPAEEMVEFEARKFFPAESIGDFIIWQKNGEAAYQLASVVDDEELQMDFIVRGRDLIPSTSGQLFLARQLNYKFFPEAQFFHHGLILNTDGSKLSKSAGKEGSGLVMDQNLFPMTLKYWREENSKKGLPSLLTFFAQCLGLANQGLDKPSPHLTIKSLPELLSAFQNRFMQKGKLNLAAIPRQDFSAQSLFDKWNA